jgi:hypothetical protein
MKRLILVATAVLALALAGGAVAGEKKPMGGMTDHSEMQMAAGEHGAETKHDHGVACTAPVHLTDEAERKPGGALYEGPMPKEAMGMESSAMGAVRVASGKPSMSAKSMKEMEGAHTMHKGMRGGELFMVPNQLHHIEVVYSLDCGYQLFFYNAFTEPIRAGRFYAFMIILPEEGDDFFEVLRFLTPSADGSHLASPISHSHDGPQAKGIFETELYVKFPENIRPMRFDVIVGTEVKWE